MDCIDLSELGLPDGLNNVTVREVADGVELDTGDYGEGTILLQGLKLSDMESVNFMF